MPLSFPRRDPDWPLKAVTLVEILISLGIVAVLAVMVLSASRTLGERAREAKCLSNHRSIIQAALAYAGDHGGTLPGNVFAGADDGTGFTQQKLSSYLDVPWRDDPNWQKHWLCPSRTGDLGEFPFSSYAFTQELFGLGHGNPPLAPVKLSTIDRPSKSAAFACVIGNYSLFRVYAYTHTENPPVANLALGQLAPWHRGGTIISFMDGHSQWVEGFHHSDPQRHWFALNHPNAP